jgi:hypothetical protein
MNQILKGRKLILPRVSIIFKPVEPVQCQALIWLLEPHLVTLEEQVLGAIKGAMLVGSGIVDFCLVKKVGKHPNLPDSLRRLDDI